MVSAKALGLALAIAALTVTRSAGVDPGPGDTRAPASSSTTQPPIDLLWVIRAGPASGRGAFEPTMGALNDLLAIARRVRARPLLLVSGDMAEEMLARRKLAPVRALRALRGEVGVWAPLLERLGTRAWRAVGGSSRLGPVYDGALTRRILADHTTWVRRLWRLPVIAFATESVRCSDEAASVAMRELTLAVGNRRGMGMLEQGERVPVPWRPAASDAPGEELRGDPSGALIEVDLGGQVGDTAADGLDGSVFRQEGEFERLCRRRGEDRITRPWVFAVLTEASPQRRVLSPEVRRFIEWLSARTHPQAGHERLARWATPEGIVTSFNAWAQSHPGDPGFSSTQHGPPPEPTALSIRKAQQDLLVKVRREVGKVRTDASNREERWCAIEIWIRVLADSRPERLEKAVGQGEREALAKRMLAPNAALDAAIDDLLARLEAASR